MAAPLRVLIVEDSRDETELILNVLRLGNIEAVHRQVGTSEEMTVALAEQEWDIVISNYSLPRFSAPEAIEVLKESGLDLPFIIVSGTIKVDDAVSLMKAGAHDFVHKSDLVRLVPAIQRELRDADIRHEQAKSAIIVHKLSQVVEQNPASVTITDIEGKIEYTNASFERITGYSFNEIFRTTPRILKPGLLCEENHRQLWQTISSGREWRGEYQDINKDGENYWVEALITPVTEADGTITNFVIIQQDITERKNSVMALYESEKRFRDIVEVASDWFWEMGPDLRFTYLSSHIEDHYRADPYASLGKARWEIADTSENPEAWNRHLDDLKNHRLFRNFKYHVVLPTGERLLIKVSGKPKFSADGEFLGYLGATTNLTKREEE